MQSVPFIIFFYYKLVTFKIKIICKLTFWQIGHDKPVIMDSNWFLLGMSGSMARWGGCFWLCFRCGAIIVGTGHFGCCTCRRMLVRLGFINMAWFPIFWVRGFSYSTVIWTKHARFWLTLSFRHQRVDDGTRQIILTQWHGQCGFCQSSHTRSLQREKKCIINNDNNKSLDVCVIVVTEVYEKNFLLFTCRLLPLLLSQRFGQYRLWPLSDAMPGISCLFLI